MKQHTPEAAVSVFLDFYLNVALRVRWLPDVEHHIAVPIYLPVVVLIRRGCGGEDNGTAILGCQLPQTLQVILIRVMTRW